MDDAIRFILETALRAPSGDNMQLLHWIVRGDTLELLRSPKEDLLNRMTLDRAFFVSVGTMVENVVIAATTRGYRTGISYFPDTSRTDLIAIVRLVVDTSVIADPLAQVLMVRATNRKPYTRQALTSDERTPLLALSGELGEMRLLEDTPSIKLLSQAVSVYDELIFSTKVLHNNFFNLISWTKREDERRRTGFYFPTLSAPPFSWGAMQLLRHWWIMKLGIALGLHRLLAFEQRQVYQHAGAYGMILARGDTPLDWVLAGRLVERSWLTATKAGLSFQPLTGTLYLALGMDSEESRNLFSLKQQNRIKKARATLAQLFGVEDRNIAFMFRIGHGNSPGARTSRLPFEKMVQIAAPVNDSPVSVA